MKRKTRKHKTGLRSRLTQGHIFILLIATFIFSSAFFWYYIISQTETEQRQLETVADTASAQIENSIFMLDSIAVQLSTNSYIAQALDTIQEMNMNDDDADLFFLNEIDSFIWSYIVRTDVASRICIYDDTGTFIAVGSSVTDAKTSTCANILFFTELEDAFAQGSVVQYYVHEDDRLSTATDAGYISAIRAIRDINASINAPTSGYAEVQLSLSAIEKQFRLLDQEAYQFALYDGETNAFLAGDDSFLTEEALAEYAQSAQVVSYQGGFLQVVQIEDTELLLCVYNDASELRTNAARMVALLLLFVVTVIALVVLVEVRFVNRMTEPLLNLFEQVRESGNAKDVRITSSGKEDELTELRDSFESMLDALQKSSDQLMGAQISKLRAQLLALQAQIDPHFIHNTLSVIVALAQEEDYQQVEEVAMRLSEIIRYSSSFDEPMCTLAQEIKHLENYLELLCVRYEDNFSYQIAWDTENKNVRVPRFIAQPIAENALKYSLKQVDYQWNIQVECESDAYFWRLIVTDNGLGITQDRADEIMKQTFHAINEGVDNLLEELKIGGLSLLNIAARLYLTYGDDMIFCICPAEEKGTKVILGGRIHAD